jgi:hypothetical protein
LPSPATQTSPGLAVTDQEDDGGDGICDRIPPFQWRTWLPTIQTSLVAVPATPRRSTAPAGGATVDQAVPSKWTMEPSPTAQISSPAPQTLINIVGAPVDTAVHWLPSQ